MENIEGEEVNVQELVSNLSTYKQQLQQVRQLLDDDPKNSEYLDMEKELLEVIELTEELLATAKQSDSNSGLGTGISTEPSSASHFSGSSSDLLKEMQEVRHLVFHRRVSAKEVREALKRMKPGKAVGPDEIPI